VEVDGKTLRFKKAVIATGSRAIPPTIEGIEEAGFLTNETVFSLVDRPEKLAVIGAGPIGCELAQAFQRLGSQVSLIYKYPHILNREDADAAEIVQSAFVKEGMNLILDAKPLKAWKENGQKIIQYEKDGQLQTETVNEILVGIGRQPNVEGLNLDAVGVQYDIRKGIIVTDSLQTTNPRIYAAGDVAMKYKFTHAADATARIVIQNTLFHGRKKLSALTIPWCTYTEPEVAHVGMYEAEARSRGIEVSTFIRRLEEVDRSITDGEEEGFVKVHVKKGSDKIIGATIVAKHAGNMISEITLAMMGKIGLGTIASVIHPYPTVAEAIKQVGDAYNRTRLTPLVKKLFSGWLAMTR
jgi:pyruvate/2-oxoglutarate dehydrogenase complex dihydrolipoamide dehydrogenase (E3) component